MPVLRIMPYLTINPVFSDVFFKHHHLTTLFPVNLKSSRSAGHHPLGNQLGYYVPVIVQVGNDVTVKKVFKT